MLNEQQIAEINKKRIDSLRKMGVDIDDEGFVTRLCVIQESGCQLGPVNGYEFHIVEFIPNDDKEFGKQWVAKKNRYTDLPFYLSSVKVKVVGEMEKITDADLTVQGIKTLEVTNLRELKVGCKVEAIEDIPNFYNSRFILPKGVTAEVIEINGDIVIVRTPDEICFVNQINKLRVVG